MQSASGEANWFAASQEIPRISRNPKVHYRTHKRPPPASILGHPSTVHIPTSHRSILILSTHLHLGLPSGLLPSVSPPDPIHPPLPHMPHMKCYTQTPPIGRSVSPKQFCMCQPGHSVSVHMTVPHCQRRLTAQCDSLITPSPSLHHTDRRHHSTPTPLHLHTLNVLRQCSC